MYLDYHCTRYSLRVVATILSAAVSKGFFLQCYQLKGCGYHATSSRVVATMLPAAVLPTMKALHYGDVHVGVTAQGFLLLNKYIGG